MSRFSFDRWLTATLQQAPLRTNSLITTVFGDAILPHGGAAMLGSLITLLAPLRVNSRAVRTSAYRLVQEGWLEAALIGRRSEYSLTASGRRRITHAYHRIYDTPQKEWNGTWQIVIVPEGLFSHEQREALRRDLLWAGFGTLSPGVYANPTTDLGLLHEIATQTGSDNKIAVLSASSLGDDRDDALQVVVQQSWRLDQLADDYRRFIDRFEPTLDWLTKRSAATPEQLFLLRTLLIHEFRRAQLRDPQLPQRLLGERWPGTAARQLCREIYNKVLPGSEQHLSEILTTHAGEVPAAEASLYERFR